MDKIFILAASCGVMALSVWAIRKSVRENWPYILRAFDIAPSPQSDQQEHQYELELL